MERWMASDVRPIIGEIIGLSPSIFSFPLKKNNREDLFWMGHTRKSPRGVLAIKADVWLCSKSVMPDQGKWGWRGEGVKNSLSWGMNTTSYLMQKSDYRPINTRLNMMYPHDFPILGNTRGAGRLEKNNNLFIHWFLRINFPRFTVQGERPLYICTEDEIFFLSTLHSTCENLYRMWFTQCIIRIIVTKSIQNQSSTDQAF